MQDPNTTTNMRELALIACMKSAWFLEAAAKECGKNDDADSESMLDDARNTFTQSLKALFFMPDVCA